MILSHKISALMEIIDSYDTVGKLTFGQPIGYLEKGADVHGLIKRQRQFHGYLNVVGTDGSDI